MLYFSKLKILTVLIFTLIFSFFAISNLTSIDDNFFKRKINLGLDLQGGSYLLLEIDPTPIIIQKSQEKLNEIRDYFKKNNIKYQDLSLQDNEIKFSLQENDAISIKDILEDKDSTLNPYYDNYKSHEFEFENKMNTFTMKYSRYGIIQIKLAAQEQALEIIRRRIDEVGTNEPNILKRGNNRILVELPGLDDPDRIKSLIGKTANLTFRFVLKGEEESFGSELIYSEDDEEEILVSKRIILGGDNLIDAQPRMDTEVNETVVTFTLDRVGARKFGKATTKNIGRRLAIVLDDQVISAPVIRDAIITGSGQISGDFTFQSATDLALLLRSGALPAPLEIIEERTVGPGLGEDSIKSGIFALIIGSLLVIFFMIFKYRIFGLIANISLFTNLLLLIGILTLFEATLTLPGIAGIILTVGMAVDANVLIYERIKEESKKTNKSNLIIFDNGYTKSRTAIIDANITTLLAAIILFVMGSGPVKGFSVTLGVGIITTLFSVYFISRLLNSLYVTSNKNKSFYILR